MTRTHLTRRAVLRTGAALGGAGSLSAVASAADGDSVVVVDGDTGERVWYNLVVSGEITGRATAMDASKNDSDWVESASGAGGYVQGWRDAYAFTGDLLGVWTSGDDADVDFFVDGRHVDPDPLSVVSIRNDDAATRVSYELSTTGPLTSSAARGASVDDGDAVSESSASGFVVAGTDSYAFVGDVENLTADGGLSVVVDGENVGYDGSWPPESDSGSGGSGGSDSFRAQLERRIHEEVNARRREAGVAEVGYGDELAAAAREHSEDMVERGYFSHTAPGDDGFADHYRDEGVDCSALGENILYRSLRSDDVGAVAATVVEQWMNSSGHRENILRASWSVEGIGVARTDDDVLYATEGFASGC